MCRIARLLELPGYRGHAQRYACAGHPDVRVVHVHMLREAPRQQAAAGGRAKFVRVKAVQLDSRRNELVDVRRHDLGRGPCGRDFAVIAHVAPA